MTRSTKCTQTYINGLSIHTPEASTYASIHMYMCLEFLCSSTLVQIAGPTRVTPRHKTTSCVKYVLYFHGRYDHVRVCTYQHACVYMCIVYVCAYVSMYKVRLYELPVCLPVYLAIHPSIPPINVPLGMGVSTIRDT